ncbi:Clp protease N-terminal domain-containing protein [Sphaerisporangium sp. TRM90804]|uniref:Clp protease N-terminal domain-containing protein n=1 Tax=Sphaerisporangium sp. TRM90804 TaxID=3031113 RepID=UPI00244933E5|nr:Clp protease N-terminal domain-containing protein [Sphaerisporangium sp. TRM90804]MDH2429910.1 Clp protease N-terminal domain-containing protein [Sphaerisporangium sp. TRM90804]
MFERFHADARQAVTLAQTEARLLTHDHIGSEHLLLALLRQTGTVPARVLARHGIDHDQVSDAVVRRLGGPAGDDLDAEALGSIGVDLDAVREKVEAVFGPGALDRKPARRRGLSRLLGEHLPFSPHAKKALELSLREALNLKHDHIAAGHILLGLLRDGDGLAARVLADAGLDLAAVRQDVRTELG